ncbi:MAG: Phosphoglycerate kinase [Microgenomates bacterium OLB23]|nr:MAG: Phosphoglycerate kinase [Microgenomates bacterium OLB23]
MQLLATSNISNKKVILRVDFNVPLDASGSIENEARIIAVKPTLEHLLAHENKVIIISYLGRPKKYDKTLSLAPVVRRLNDMFPNYKAVLVNNFLEDDSLIATQKENEIIVLENIRFHPEEQNNDEEYIKKIASYADVFVNDAFSMSHRNEATITGLPKYLNAYAGFLLEKEVTMLQKALGTKGAPRVTILGGAKVSTKIHLIEKFIETSDYILLGGALANTFLAAQDYAMGGSLYEKDFLNVARDLVKAAQDRTCALLIPFDMVKNSEASIMDIGSETLKSYEKIIAMLTPLFGMGPWVTMKTRATARVLMEYLMLLPPTLLHFQLLAAAIRLAF